MPLSSSSIPEQARVLRDVGIAVLPAWPASRTRSASGPACMCPLGGECSQIGRHVFPLNSEDPIDYLARCPDVNLVADPAKSNVIYTLASGPTALRLSRPPRWPRENEFDWTLTWGIPEGQVFVWHGVKPELTVALNGTLRVLSEPISLPPSFLGYSASRALVERHGGHQIVRVIEGHATVLQWSVGPWWGGTVKQMPSELRAVLTKKTAKTAEAAAEAVRS